jgi:hypothetical protein
MANQTTAKPLFGGGYKVGYYFHIRGMPWYIFALMDGYNQAALRITSY